MRRSGGGRRRLYLIGAVLLVVALVGGRWLAVETAERAWDRTFAGGTALIEARTLGRMLQGLVLVFAVAWLTGNLLIVYRAIGSVQMPRRLGDLEIVEAVPQRVLFWITVLAGVALGVVFSLGTGDWWRYAVLAAAPPQFGVADQSVLRPPLPHDPGYYIGVIPWLAALQHRALVLAAGAVGIVALLYAVIGSLRIRRGRVRASDYARAHWGVLLAVLALVIGWGAVLDPSEVVAGLHGVVDQAALSVRIPGAAAVATIAVVTAVISLVWAWRDRPNLIVAGWAALLLAVTIGYFVIPGVVRTSGGPDSVALTQRRAQLEAVAFGLTRLDDRAPPAFASAEAALRALPVWDRTDIALAVGAPPTAVALHAQTAGGTPTWLVAPTATPATIREALETDTGLVLRPWPGATPDSTLLFAPAMQGHLIASTDSIRSVKVSGVPITGPWRRFAIAWTIQAWSLLRSDSNARVLLWRRDVTDRLERLAPFAQFGTPTPTIRNGKLWWVSWGYVTHEAFPLARPIPWRDGQVRYLRAGLVGAVRAGTGETHLWLAPGYDSLTATWARRFEPLIEPANRLPADVREQLAYPIEQFKAAVAQLLRTSADSTAASVGAEAGDSIAGWSLRPREPFELVTPDGALWTGIGFESGTLKPKRFVGLCAGAVTPRGVVLHLWRPAAADPERLPGELVGSSQQRPGELRIWPADGSIITVQAQMLDPIGAHPAPPPRVAEVHVSFDGRIGRGLTARAALHGGEQVVTDTSMAARWERVRRLAVQADSALTAGDLELFGRLWRALMIELAPLQRRR
ncbi:MAG TPA: UPF0182 family protein [Gemmatimonadales bacterium]|nr:UPF0182 family protein [Gemmatimonadales bacterium]